MTDIYMFPARLAQPGQQMITPIGIFFAMMADVFYSSALERAIMAHLKCWSVNPNTSTFKHSMAVSSNVIGVGT